MKRFLDYIPAARGIFATATFKQSSVTFLGTFVNGLLGAGFYILAARALGPAGFGLMAVAIATLTLVGDIGDLGTDTGLVRFVSKYLKDQKDKAYRFLKLALEVKLVVGVVVAILGFLLSPFIAQTIFQKLDLLTPLRIGFFGVGTALLFAFSISAFQSFQRFWMWSGIQIGTNAVRLLVIVLLWFYGSLDLNSTLLVYIILPFLGFIGSLFFIPRDFLRVPRATKVAGEYFNYSKWVALFTVLAALSARLDTFISARLLPASEVGFYSAANQLVLIVPQIVVALGTVIAPKMAGMEKEKFPAYLRKAQFLVLALAGLGILAIPVVVFLIPLLYGAAYAASVPPLFVVLLLGMLIFLISVPVHNAVFYYYGYPKLFVWVSAGHLLIIAVLGWQMISAFGAMGAAVTTVVGHSFNFLLPLFWVLKRLASGKNK